MKMQVSVFMCAKIIFGYLKHHDHTNPANEFENTTICSAGGDATSGFTNAQIFSTMNSNMTSIPQMKTALIPLFSPTTPITTYNTLCAAYGF
jgi:hypothetical protein